MCDADYTGGAYRLVEAVNRETKHKARHMCMVLHPFGYPVGVQTRSPAVVRELVAWADIVNVHATFRPLRVGGMKELKPRNLMITHRGRYYRRNSGQVNARAKRRGVKRQLCSTADLTQYGPVTWMPTAIPQDRYKVLRKRRYSCGLPIVCQAPSNARMKRTEEVRALLGGRSDIQLMIVQGRHHDVALRRISKADIFIDRFRIGLGTGGLEAAAMGIPVIAWANQADEACILREVGYLPYYKATMEDLPAAVNNLLSQPNLYNEYAERGQEYIRTFHDYLAIAKRYVTVCEEIAGGI